MSWKMLLLAGLLSVTGLSQELPPTKTPLPSRKDIAAAGWVRFESWCAANVIGYTPATKDQMARLYRSVRDEVTANEVDKLPPAAIARLETAYRATVAWLELRAPLAGVSSAPLCATLADLKHDCVYNWGGSPDPDLSKYWPDSWQEAGGKGDKQKLATEAAALSEAAKQVRKVVEPSRQRLQQFLLKTGEQLAPKSTMRASSLTG